MGTGERVAAHCAADAATSMFDLRALKERKGGSDRERAADGRSGGNLEHVVSLVQCCWLALLACRPVWGSLGTSRQSSSMIGALERLIGGRMIMIIVGS